MNPNEPDTTMRNMSMSQEQIATIKAFAKEHLKICTVEIVEWRKTGTLRDGKLRELAALCQEVFFEENATRIAESFVLDEVLNKAVRDDLNAVVQSVHEYPCVVPWVNGEPLINAIGSSETECHANLAMLDLSEKDLQAVSFHPAKVVHKTPEE